MKAEHRKELETNVLADKMGHVLQRMKTGPQRRTVLYFVLILVVVLGLFWFMRVRAVRKAELSDLWIFLEDGARDYIAKLVSAEHAETNPGKAARFQVAWIRLWDEGLKILGGDPVRALEKLGESERIYFGLLQDSKGDPIWEPEARFAIAVIAETKAISNREHLKDALQQYQDLAKDFPKSACGQMAEQRAKLLENESSYQDIANFYRDLGKELKVPEEKKLVPDSKLLPK